MENGDPASDCALQPVISCCPCAQGSRAANMDFAVEAQSGMITGSIHADRSRLHAYFFFENMPIVNSLAPFFRRLHIGLKRPVAASA